MNRILGISLILSCYLLQTIHCQGDVQCSFPSHFNRRWFMNRQGDVWNFLRFGVSRELITEEAPTGNSTKAAFDCQDDKDVVERVDNVDINFVVYVNRWDRDFSEENCVKAYVNDDQDVMVRFIQSSGTIGASADACALRTYDSQPPEIYVRDEFDYNGMLCPFADGRYQATFSYEMLAQNLCNDDQYSHMMVSGNTLTINTCVNSNTYTQPFNGAELTCIKTLPAGAIGSDNAKGQVLLATYIDDEGDRNYYVIRYQEGSDGSYLFSLQGSMSGYIYAELNSGYTTVTPLTNPVSGPFASAFVSKPSTCANIDCENGATCENVFPNNFRCICDPGFIGLFCEIDINECETKDCSGNGDCEDLVNDYNCDCDEGYVGKDCETRNYCFDNPCVFGTCESLSTGFRCTCADGWTGTTCADRLYCFDNPCKNGGICQERPDIRSFQCDCQGGYTGETCEQELYCYRNPCLPFGSCSEVVNGFKCTCQPGYAGERCNEVLECFNNPCKNDGECEEADNALGFECTCKPGFSDPICSTAEPCHDHACLNGATCIEREDTYSCDCPPGYSGWNCGDEIHCANNPCQNDAECIETENTFRCQCKEGWMGYYCDVRVYCALKPCKNGATCTDTGSTYECRCPLGFSGRDCEIAPGCGNDPCLNDGQCMEMGNGQFSCNCVDGFTGSVCQNPPNQCQNNQCKNGATCFNQDNGYTCSCAIGFRGNLCETNVCSPGPCQNNGQCEPRDISLNEDGYVCSCPDGYGGKNCELEGSCGDPCQNGGQCILHDGDFKCECVDGWQGDYCDQEPGFNMTIIIVILVVVLVMVFIVLAILVCVCCVMRNKEQEPEKKTAVNPQPAPVITREVVLPPPQVRVIQVDKKPPSTIVGPQSVVPTRAMYVTDNPQKMYVVPNPMNYQYPPTPAIQPIYSQPKKPVPVSNQDTVRYVGGLDPPGTYQSGSVIPTQL